MIHGRTWLRLVSFGLGLALTLGTLAQAGPPSAAKVQTLSYNRRSFVMPFNIPPDEVARTKEVQLWSSSDRGASWKQVAVTTPDRPLFNFTARSDGLFWFAARRVDAQGRLFPADDADIEPNMKVTIDTKKPTMTIDPRTRRGNVATIEWDVTDETAIDLTTLAFDFQVEGSTDWQPIPLDKQARIGVQPWDAGTSQPIKIRGVVSDLAKNQQVVVINLPGSGGSDELLEPPADRGDLISPPPIGVLASNEATRASTRTPASKRAADPNSGGHDPFENTSTERLAANDSPAPASDPSNPPILVASPKFGLQYAVEDAGPNGPARVELFVTNDNGRTWTSRGEDTDRMSPFQVDLGGEGRFGLKLVAKSAANQGDRPPVPGETPQTVVEVDSTPPTITLDEAKLVGNRLLIRWHANDLHPAERPVILSIKADAPDARWQIITPAAVDNSGQYQWLVSPKCPPKIFVRVDIRDALGNLGFAETPETSPVIVDRTKPKSRILGLDAGNPR